jgi:predicted metal-dependent peptidase
MTVSLHDEIVKSRLHLMSKYPFYASTAMRLEICVSETYRGQPVPIAGTDGKVIVYNPKTFGDMIKPQRLTVMMHEYMHPILGHDVRGIGFDHTLWNIATDHVINLHLEKMGFSPVENWLCDHKFIGWHEERVYAYLKNEFDKKPQKPNNSGSQDQSSNSDSSDDSQGSMSSSQSSGEGEGNTSAPGSKYDSMPDAGRVIGTVFDRKNDDGSDLSSEDIESIKQENKLEAARGKIVEKFASSGGTGFGGSFIADSIINEKEDWRVILQQWIAEHGAPNGDFSWEGLNKRDLCRGVFSPLECEDGIDWIVVGFDVSGSVGLEERGAFVSQMATIREQIPIKRMSIVPFSGTIKSRFISELDAEDEMPTKFPYGGGTNFAPVFNWVRRQDDTPDMIIMFTDLGSTRYGDEPDCPILWASSEPIGKSTSPQPPFGDTVEISI